MGFQYTKEYVERVYPRYLKHSGRFNILGKMLMIPLSTLVILLEFMYCLLLDALGPYIMKVEKRDV